jgi:hypothetical protein
MPWVMLAYLSVGFTFQPQMVQIEFANAEACLAAGKSISENINAIGFCIDRFTGNTAIWAGTQPSEAPAPSVPSVPQKNLPR